MVHLTLGEHFVQLAPRGSTKSLPQTGERERERGREGLGDNARRKYPEL